MSLNLCEILQKVLNESVGSNEVVDVINKRRYVTIEYSDENNNAPGKRLIQPYDYGLTKAGNEALRAFQVSGDSLRGQPGWKMFLLSGINYWQPSNKTFNIPPPMQGYDAPEYNEEGDGSMSVVYSQVKFNNDLDDTLSFVKAQREFVRNVPKISSKNNQGPIPYANQQWKKNVFTSQPNSKKYAQYAKNIKDTENDFNRFDDDIWSKAEAEKEQQKNLMLQNSVKVPQQNQQGPINTKNNDKKNDEK